MGNIPKENWIYIVNKINEVRVRRGEDPHPPEIVEEMAEKLSRIPTRHHGKKPQSVTEIE